MSEDVLKRQREQKIKLLHQLGKALIIVGLIVLGIVIFVGTLKYGVLGFVVIILKGFLNAFGYPDLATQIAAVNQTPDEKIGGRIVDIVMLLSLFVGLPAGIVLNVMAQKLERELQSQTKGQT